MITAEEALRQIHAHTPILSTEPVGLEHAVDRVLCEDLFARTDLPPFDNSAMDGYAVRVADLEAASEEHPVLLPVNHIIKAGDAPVSTLPRGRAIKIMTGAPLPSGADAVIMREATHEEADAVRIARRPRAGDCLRLRGEDVRLGELLLRRGAALRPYEISLLAAQGFDSVPVFRRPRVAVVTTGGELSPADRPGGIRDSNGPALAAALRKHSEAVIRFQSDDDPERLASTFRQALLRADVLLVSGGVSAGDFDHTRAALAACGFREIFWKVAIKPGMPLLFGHCPGEPAKVVFGLPGNPLSTLVCLEEFVLPALDKMQGREPAVPAYHLHGKVLEGFTKSLEKQQFLFCRAVAGDGGFNLHILRPQGSALVKRASEANALAVAPIGIADIAPGDELTFRWLR